MTATCTHGQVKQKYPTMGNWIQYPVRSKIRAESGDEHKVTEIPNHLLVEIIRSLNENDVTSFRSVCKQWNWLVSIIPSYRLPKLHVARLGVDCRFEGGDVVWIKQRNCSITGYIRGNTRESTLRKLRRLTCDELRLCGHQQPTVKSDNSDQTQAGSPPGSRRNSFGDGETPSFYVAVNPTFFTTILESSRRTLTRVYIFRCSLFRFMEKDISTLANVENLTTLSISRVSDANAVNDASLLPVIARVGGTLEKLVLDRTMITDRLLIAIGERCKKLSLLSVLGCAGVTERGVSAVANASLSDGAKVICRQTGFECMRFLRDAPRFRLSTSGRALELPQRKISIHFV